MSSRLYRAQLCASPLPETALASAFVGTAGFGEGMQFSPEGTGCRRLCSCSSGTLSYYMAEEEDLHNPSDKAV